MQRAIAQISRNLCAPGMAVVPRKEFVGLRDSGVGALAQFVWILATIRPMISRSCWDV
jgi:hypothetical protein